MIKANRNISVLILWVITCLNTTLAQESKGISNPINVDFSNSRNILSEKPLPPTIEDELRVANFPLYHALIITVSDYQYSGAQLPDLNNPVQDGKKLRDLLISKYAFPESKCHLIENPTREQLINALDDLISQVTSKDNVLIFFAGHGFYDKSTDFGYWLPADAKMTSRSNWIANSTLKDYIAAIPSRHTLLISDACFAGSIFKSRSTSAAETRMVFELYKDKSRKAMTSGNMTQVPDESYFLKFLLKTLSENKQDFLPASTLFTRIFEPIVNNSETIPQFSVVYGTGDEGGDFIFIKGPVKD